ncbi:hypothetical protein [Moraxella lacunata]|uniref:Uncharacterized protein n=1 Tax=Moraxella lacunata TaxID=477 RepID=A0A1B8PVM5_MORLA|nr:hypothetical protein A9Z63_12350 [Moraxella lacunata]OBX59514.1 hypothetical protein A9309_11285 [Moraxella lacunata]
MVCPYKNDRDYHITNKGKCIGVFWDWLWYKWTLVKKAIFIIRACRGRITFSQKSIFFTKDKL